MRRNDLGFVPCSLTIEMLRIGSAMLRPVSPRPRSSRKSIAFIGAGALATSLARSLAASGYTISEFVLRTTPTRTKPGAKLKTLARGLNAKLTTFQDCTLEADILWLAVPDDAIEDCAKRLSKRRNLRGKIALHSSGALS